MPLRFNVGDRVRILPEAANLFVGLEGTIKEVQPHNRDIVALDRYIVVFEWGEKQSFYDVQLVRVEAQKP